MKLPVFRLEEYLSQYEFSAPFLFCCSDAESLSQSELLSLADDETSQMWSDLGLGYTEVPGHPLLREEIAKLYDLEAEHIRTFSGAEDAIYCVLNSLLCADDHVIVFTPCYQSLSDLPKSLGVATTEIELSEDAGWKPDFEQVRNAIRSNTKMLVINFPHNPTGAVLDNREVGELVDIARSNGMFILSDEVYRLLGPSEAEWSSPFATVYEKGISVGVMSKAYGLAGLRVGWIACQDESALKSCEQYRHYTSICSSAPSEILSLIALRAADTILDRNRRIVDDNLVLLEEFFERQSHLFGWVKPEGGCVGFVRYRGSTPTWEMAEDIVKTKGTLILPAKVYGYRDDYFRVGFGRSNMPDALVRFEEYVEKHL